jgi:hypothetical protein
MTSHLAQLQEQLASFLPTARQQLTEIESDIEKKQAEITELREERRQVRSILISLDPSFVEEQRANGKLPGTKPKRAQRHARGKLPIGKERRDRIVAWLQEHAEELNEGDGFYVTGLIKRPDWQFAGQSPTNKIMNMLREEGIITLSRIGENDGSRGARQRKFYKVIV